MTEQEAIQRLGAALREISEVEREAVFSTAIALFFAPRTPQPCEPVRHDPPDRETGPIQ